MLYQRVFVGCVDSPRGIPWNVVVVRKDGSLWYPYCTRSKVIFPHRVMQLNPYYTRSKNCNILPYDDVYVFILVA